MTPFAKKLLNSPNPADKPIPPRSLCLPKGGSS